MKFYIDGEIVTSEKMPLVVILSEQDKKNISNMDPEAITYCEFDKDKHYPGEISNLLTEARAANDSFASKESMDKIMDDIDESLDGKEL